MKTWAVVPVKALERAKSRLAGVLGEETRRSLSEWLLRRTLDILAGVEEIDKTLVVTSDRSVRLLAHDCGAMVLEEGSPAGLNPAVTRATRFARSRRVSRLLVLPADLPLLECSDIEALIDVAPPPPGLVLAPDRHRSGTNAMLITPPGLIEYAFGALSFIRHRELAQAAGASVAVCERPGLALDLDGPQDLALLPKQLIAAVQQRPRE